MYCVGVNRAEGGSLLKDVSVTKGGAGNVAIGSLVTLQIDRPHRQKVRHQKNNPLESTFCLLMGISLVTTGRMATGATGYKRCKKKKKTLPYRANISNPLDILRYNIIDLRRRTRETLSRQFYCVIPC